jgi:hypothetical protein
MSVYDAMKDKQFNQRAEENTGKTSETSNSNTSPLHDVFNNGKRDSSANDGNSSWGASIINLGYIKTSHNLEVIQKDITNYYREMGGNDSYKLSTIPVPSGTNGLAIDIFIMAIKLIRENVTYIPYYTFILAHDPEEMPTTPGYSNNANKEVVILPSDYYDPVMTETTRNLVEQYYRSAIGENAITTNECVFLNADATVVPKSFDFKDQSALKSLITNTLLACGNAVENYIGFPDLNAANIKLGNGQRLVQTVRFNNGNVSDALGSPVRADITLDMSLTKQITNDDIYSPNRLLDKENELITSVTGYIDLLYNPIAQPSNGLFTQNPNQQNQLTRYNPVFVITSLMCTKKHSLGATLLALINSSFLTQNQVWTQALIGNNNINNKNPMHDLGNLAYDITNGKDRKFATDPASFNATACQQFISAYFYPDLVYAIDIPDAGPASWLTNDIYRAAITAPNAGGEGQEARENIVNAMDTLTNGQFSSLYKEYGGDGSFFSSKNTRIILGEYNDNGRVSDVRDLDYIAMAGYAGKSSDVQLLDSWVNTFNREDIPSSARLYKRYQLMQAALTNMSLVGYGIRAYIEPIFITAAQHALRNCGYNVIPNYPYMNSINQNTRATASYVNNSVLSGNGGDSIFNYDNRFSSRNGYKNGGTIFGRSNIFNNN